jgi:hypothetical protein
MLELAALSLMLSTSRSSRMHAESGEETVAEATALEPVALD